MVFITNPFLLPFLLIVWSSEAWLFLASIKLVFEKIPSMKNNRIILSLNQLTNPPVSFTQNLTSRLVNKTIPLWASWLITFICIILFRHILIVFLMSAQVN